jgi:hypothetical protein
MIKKIITSTKTLLFMEVSRPPLIILSEELCIRLRMASATTTF